ncbi:MAG: right-handed parallel beta-helix repeat-containing protein [bacterium]
MKYSIILLIVLISIFAFTACMQDTPVTPTDKIVTISEDITQDITFRDGFTYIIKGTIRVKNATITVQPGATISLQQDAELDFAYLTNETATIRAIGTTEKPITFTSSLGNPTNLEWDCLYFFKGAKNCVFEHCIFEYGGDEANKGMIVMKESAVSFKSCTFRKSASSAVYLKADAYFTEFTSNTLTDNASYAIIITPNYVHTIGEGNTYSTTSGIFVSNDTYLNKSGTFTWLNQGTPYIIEGDMRIGSPGNGTILNIAPGNVIKFMQDAQFTIAYGNNDIGTITANGTANEKILFTAFSSSPVKQDWKGFDFKHGSRNCNFNFCEVTHAGSSVSSSAVFYLSQCGTEVTISNSLIAHSISYGISVDATTTVDRTTIAFEDIDKETYHVR